MRRIRWDRVFGAIGIVITITLLLCGLYDGPQRLVEAEYTVKRGDTLWTIAEEYIQYNTGGEREIREFKQGIVELNPKLKMRNEKIYAGEKLRINYWVKD